MTQQIENDPELSGKYLGKISQDFIKVSDTLREAAYQIKKRGFSDHPIFIISKRKDLHLGQILLAAGELGTEWSYYASFLDEFAQLKLIEPDKIEAFKANYKDPSEFCCLFVIDEGFTNFLFIPYPVD